MPVKLYCQNRLTSATVDTIIKYMIKTTTIIWICTILFLVAITTKTLAHDSMTDKVNNWVADEKEKTIAYQKQSWAEGKDQLNNTWNSIKNLFQKQAQ